MNASFYLKIENVNIKKGGDSMTLEKWECTACGYVYDPEKGDPENGISPGTPFESLPEDWVCPQCGVSKDFFQKIES